MDEEGLSAIVVSGSLVPIKERKESERKESEMEKGVFFSISLSFLVTPSLIRQINPIARKIGKTHIFSDFRVKTNESVSQLMTYSVMNDVRRHRLFHFDFFIANQMIRSTVHVTHYV